MWNYRSIVVVAVPYIAVNIYNYFRPVVLIANNLIGLVFFKIGHRDLGISFGNKPSL